MKVASKSIKKKTLYNSIIANIYPLSSLILILLVLITFKDIFSTFYQQDEWLGMGQIVSEGWYHIFYGFSPLGVLFGEGRPLVRLLGLIFFSSIPLDITALGVYSLFFHALNTLIVFAVAYKLSRKYFISIIAGIFFSINSVHSQSVVWFGGAFGLLPSATFIFLSIYFVLHYLDTNKRKYLIISLLSALVSIFFKENGLFLFIFIPIITYLYNLHSKYFLKKETFFSRLKKIKNLRVYALFIIYIIAFVIFRFINQLNNNHTGNILTSADANTYDIPLTVLMNIFLYPMLSLSLIYYPPEVSLPAVVTFAKIYFPFVLTIPSADLIIQTILLSSVAITVSLLFLLLIIIVYIKFTEYKYILQFILLFIFLSILPYTVIIKGYAYLEPRYYYITSLAAGLLLGVVIDCFYNKIRFKKTYIAIIGSILLLFFSMHFLVIQKQMNKLEEISTERKAIIEDLYKIKNKLINKRNIFYLDGDKDYIVPNNKVPFQQGFGYTIMVLYYRDGKIPKEFLQKAYLWDMGTQGYRELDGYGFGFFTSLDEVKKVIRQNNLTADNVTALYYDSKTKKLTDISNSIKYED